MSFKLTILTPEGSVFQDEVDGIEAPGVEGHFGVLSGHAPAVIALQAGIVAVRKGRQSLLFALSGGVAEITDAGATVLVEVARQAADQYDAEVKLQEVMAGRSSDTR
jgi:F-type H+-transporting ATPase subunit epsilon